MSHISIIETYVKTHLKRGVTVADVATRTGLSLYDAEHALYELSNKHKGHISVTKNGVLVFSFPHGLKNIFNIKKTQHLEIRQRVLTLIRSNKGRIGWSDILRITGFKKEEIDRLLISLLVEFDGDIQVIDNGVIVYSFVSLRKTAQHSPEKIRKHALKHLRNFWEYKERRLPSKNKLSKAWGYITSLPIGLIILFFQMDEVKTALNMLSFYISCLLVFWYVQRNKEKKREQMLGRRGIIKVIFDSIEHRDFFYEHELINGYKIFAKARPCHKDIEREVIRLGGCGILDSNDRFRYCFKDLANEIKALRKEREETNINEAKLSKIIFTSKEKRTRVSAELGPFRMPL